MIKYRHSILFTAVAITAAVLLTAGCGGGGGTRVPVTREFPFVMVPELVAEDEAAAVAYIVEHYWDDFADTTALWLNDSSHVGGVNVKTVEQEFAAFVNYLGMCEFPEARQGMRRMYDAASRNKAVDSTSAVFDTLTSLTDKYLYDPNSPYRDEDLYGTYAECLTEYPGYSQELRNMYGYQARLCALNRRGTYAADFEFRDAKGRDRSLYSVEAEYTLLFFSNPGCSACYNIIKTLSEQLNVDEMIKAGKLAVLNIYIDEDLHGWYDYMPIYPTTWYNGYDPNLVIRSETLYNVRAIPSLYLLDKDKKVLLKDAPEDIMFSVLSNIASQ